MAKTPIRATYNMPLINIAVLMKVLLPGNPYNPSSSEVTSRVVRASPYSAQAVPFQLYVLVACNHLIDCVVSQLTVTGIRERIG
jgi:hypothetical protein